MESLESSPLWRKIGGPFIARGLGSYAKIFAFTSSVLTLIVLVGSVCLALANSVEYTFMSDSYFMNWDAFWSVNFVEMVGMLDLWFMVLLSLMGFAVAPTLACLTVAREASARTLDSLMISPLPARSLHLGFSLESLARLAPWAVGPVLLHFGLMLTGQIDVTTTLVTSGLFVAGSVGLTFLGTTLGVLGSKVFRGPLLGLTVFSGLILANCLPMIAIFEKEPGWILSPFAAILNTLFADSNAMLSSMENGIHHVYTGSLMSLPIIPALSALVVVGLLGAVSLHAGRRRLKDPMAPLISRLSALGAVSVVTGLACIVGADALEPLSQEIPLSPTRLGTLVSQTGTLLNFFLFPFVAGLALASIPSGDFLERTSLWSATRPGVKAPESAWRMLTRFLELGAIPIVAAVTLPFLVGDPGFLLDNLTWSTRILGLLCFGWTMAGIGGLNMMWQLSSRTKLQGVMAGLGFSVLTILGAIYTVVFVSESNFKLNDLFLSNDWLGQLIGIVIFTTFLGLPAVALGGAYLQNKSRTDQINRRLQRCAPPSHLPNKPFRWPEASSPGRGFQMMLRGTGGEASSKFFAQAKEPAHPLLCLEGDTLSCRGGEREVSLDLGRPFAWTAVVQPVSTTTEVAPSTATINLTLRQRQEGSTQPLCVAFSFVVRWSESLRSLPMQDQRLARLAPSDMNMVLGALRYYAELHGEPLPLSESYLPKDKAPLEDQEGPSVAVAQAQTVEA